MLKKELIERSPLRLLDDSIKGGLLPGCTGVFMSEKGVGKTACLVHVAIDQMLQGKKVLHISFADTTDHVAQWYDNAFKEIALESKLDQTQEIKNDLKAKRIVMRFEPGANSVSHIEKSIATLRESTGFSPGALVIDGLQFLEGSAAHCTAFKKYAESLGAAVWFSATIPSGIKNPSEEIPEPVSGLAASFDVIVRLEQAKDHILLKLLKDYDVSPPPTAHLALDPRTLLIREEKPLARH